MAEFRKAPRWTVSNALPVLFVLGIIIFIWLTHGGFHLLQLHRPVDQRHVAWVEVLISQKLVLLMMTCFIRAVITDPGFVPETDSWILNPTGSVSVLCHEVKQNGERRFCTKCSKYKPDRCHHCRVCNSCVLRMDHHCPWIANCVGFRNHKYFFLLVFYSFLNCSFIVISMASTVARSSEEEMDLLSRFALVFGTTLAVIMGGLLGCFFIFHCWLTTQALTTIEFCEKTSNMSRSVSYDQGLYENLRAILGPNIFLWLLPASPPAGDGLSFHAMEEDTVIPKHCAKESPAAPEVTGAKEASV